jgi:hypothetical protein
MNPQARHLGGGRRLAASHRIFWTKFFQEPKGNAQPSMAIDHRLSTILLEVPHRGALVDLNLRRGISLRLPSGPAVAEALHVKPLDADELWGKDTVKGAVTWSVEHFDDPALRAKVEAKTPLWFYVLREAGSGGGQHLGPVGGAIVAEVILSLMANTPGSILAPGSAFTPDLWPTGGHWTLFLLQGYVWYDGVWADFVADNDKWDDWAGQPPYA